MVYVGEMKLEVCYNVYLDLFLIGYNTIHKQQTDIPVSNMNVRMRDPITSRK